MERGGFIYFMSNTHNNVLYLGVTSNLFNRVQQHKNKEFKKSFTAKYNCDKLVYFEYFSSIEEAIAREKNLENWKNELINKENSERLDLSETIEK